MSISEEMCHLTTHPMSYDGTCSNWMWYVRGHGSGTQSPVHSEPDPYHITQRLSSAIIITYPVISATSCSVRMRCYYRPEYMSVWSIGSRSYLCCKKHHLPSVKATSKGIVGIEKGSK